MLSNTTDIPIKIQVGDVDSARSVYVHRSRLEKVSPWFKRSASPSDEIELDNVGIETLQVFYIWVYDHRIVVDGMQKAMNEGKGYGTSVAGRSTTTGNCHTKANVQSVVVDLTEDSEYDTTGDEDTGDSESDTNSTTVETSSIDTLPWYTTADLSPRERVFGQLIDLYAFGTTYEVADFSVAVVLAWQRFCHATSLHLGTTIINEVCQRVSLTSGLAQYMMVSCARYLTAELIKGEKAGWTKVSSAFHTEVLILVFEQLHGDGNHIKPDRHWCEYHDHDSEESRRACAELAGRADDPDMDSEKLKW
tara:strand:- start:1865 stop:2782 length:918 start_codon:yes stop_codon:yes gene_type:complete